MPKFVQGGIMNQNILTPCQRRRGLFLNKFDSLGKVGTFFYFSSQNDMPLKYLSSDSFVKSIFLMNYRERFICDASKHVPFENDVTPLAVKHQFIAYVTGSRHSDQKGSLNLIAGPDGPSQTFDVFLLDLHAL